MNTSSQETTQRKAPPRNTRPKTGVLAAAEEIMLRAKAIASEAAKKARPLQRKKEAIGLEIRTLETSIASSKARIDKLRVKEAEVAREVEAAEADAIATLKAMGGRPGD